MRAPEILQHSELEVKRSLRPSGRRGPLGPDPESHDLAISERVIGVPGDTVAGHEGRVFVNGKKAEDIPTNHGRVFRGGPRQPANRQTERLSPQQMRVRGLPSIRHWIRKREARSDRGCRTSANERQLRTPT